MTPEAVASLLSRHHPSLPVRTVDPLGEGDFYRAYAVDHEWVVRVARHGEAAEGLRREGCLLPRLAAHLPLRVPQPVFTFQGDGADPAFAVHAMLPGPPLTRERYLDLPEPVRERCARQVGRFLVGMHRTDLAPARACGVPAVDYRSRYSALLGEARSRLLPRLAQPERAYVENVLAEYLESEAFAEFRPVLLHGDLSPDHVLYDEEAGEVTGIIDFGDLAIGDPAWDLVYVYEDYGLDFLGRLLAAYPVDRREVLLARMHRFLELDAVTWAVRCLDEEDGAELEDAVEYLGGVREQAHSPPWRALL